jgi:Delta7-sterol 5-desaturase
VGVSALPLPAVFGLTCAFFLALYVGFAALATRLTRGHVAPPREGQRRAEVLASLGAIAVFGLWGTLAYWAAGRGWLRLGLAPRPERLVPQLAALLLWNEVHFYLCHRLLHTPWLYRHVHRTHHRSAPPTPWATYSFHPLEAALLGSVPLWLMPFFEVDLLALGLFSLASLALNTLGHLGELRGAPPLLGISARHAQHHRSARGNFGFLLPQPDRWLGTALPPAGSR